MDHLSARRQRIWEAMESCRYGSDDLSDPEFAELAAGLAEGPELRVQFQRLQQADAAIKTAFADVSVPAGLANRVSRLLTEAMPAALPESLLPGSLPPPANCLETPLPLTDAAATTSDSSATASGNTERASHRATPLREATERFSRRRLLAGFAALSAAAVLLAAVWIQTHRPRHESPSSVLEEAMDFFDKDNQPVGELVSSVAPPARYPLSRDIVPLQGIRWRHLASFLGDPAVAYDLPTIGGRATLYVVERSVTDLPSIPPSSPLSTGGKSAAAWQAGNMLYVLVVEGNAGMYSSYLDQSHGPLT